MKNPCRINLVRGGVTLVLMMALLSTGCQGVPFSPVGKSVPEAQRIALEGGGERKGTYRNDDLTLDYQFVRNLSELSLSGRFRCTDRLSMNFIFVDYFHLDVFFLDAQGKILGISGLFTATADSRMLYDWVEFKHRLILPPNTASMAFSYTGKVLSEGGDANVMDFWEYPAY
jgi:hypothetical protein